MAREITSAEDLRFDHPDQDGTLPNQAVRAMQGMTLWVAYGRGKIVTLVEAPDIDEAMEAIRRTTKIRHIYSIHAAGAEDLALWREMNNGVMV